MHDYNFWIYIVTNVHDSTLYIGMTNDLARRIAEHRSGEIAGFTSAYRCRKLIYYNITPKCRMQLRAKRN
jgi:putative endonuclease